VFGRACARRVVVEEVVMRVLVRLGIISLTASLLVGTGCISATTDEVLDAARRASASRTAAPPEREAATEDGDCFALAARVAPGRPARRVLLERARAEQAAATSERDLPSGEVALEVWDFPLANPSLADRRGMYMVHVSQTFTPLGGRDGRTRARGEEALALDALTDEVVRDTVAEIAHACVDWAASVDSLAQLEQERALASTLREATVARLASGGSLASVAAVDVELARLRRLEAELQLELERARDTLAALVAPAPLPASPPRLTGEAAAELSPLERGFASAVAHRRRASEARVDAAEAEAVEPTIGLRASYMQMPGERPAFGAMVSTTLPWLWGGGGARVDAAEAELRASRAEEAEVARGLSLERLRATGRWRAAKRSLESLRTLELPALERGLEAARASAAGPGLDLAELLDASRALVAARREELELTVALAHASVDVAAAGAPAASADGAGDTSGRRDELPRSATPPSPNAGAPAAESPSPSPAVVADPRGPEGDR
jgi:outer membrane protein TolC